jgi:L-ascorbate metabolism protein UlaG (beta-lactamase superfamily)
MNTGGTVTFKDVRITMVPAIHTSSITEDGATCALGFPVGYVLRFANGFTIYNTGDTAVTMDMKIVRDLYKPDLVILPIGDYYTMGAEQAAYALNLLQPKFALGGHWGTWNGMPPGTPEALEKELAQYKIPTQLIKLKPGESLT